MTLQHRLAPSLIAVLVAGCGAAAPNRTMLVTDPSSLAGKLTVFDEHLQPGVVIIALKRIEAGDSDPFFGIQMGIASAMVKSGPIIIAIPDSESRERISKGCDQFPDVCDAIAKGTARVLEVEHDGPWVRDYGPQIGRGTGGEVAVFDANYNDLRQRKQLLRKQVETDNERLLLLKRREALDDDESHEQFQIDDRLKVLAQLKDVYSDSGINARDEDDESPYFFAQAAFRAPTFSVIPTGIAIDGGNLMVLGRGVCATTSDVIPANDKSKDVETVLREVYGCQHVLYLSPLPGPVIKHVDMFLLPVNDHSVLLASYDPTDNALATYWDDADDSTRTLTMEAALAMNTDAALLQEVGFSVTRVVAPLPRSDVRFGTYFPTNLNALIRVDSSGTQHVVAPKYDDYEVEVQAIALKQIGDAFGPSNFATVEATEAGKRQGAVHCLSLVLPLDLTVFADPKNMASWAAWNTRQTKVSEKQKAIEARLHGNWYGAGEGKSLEFGDNGRMFIHDSDGITAGRFRLRKAGEMLEISDPKKSDSIAMRVEWHDKDHVSLIDGDSRLDLARGAKPREKGDKQRPKDPPSNAGPSD